MLPRLLFLPPPELLPHSPKALADAMFGDVSGTIFGPGSATSPGWDADDHGGRDQHIQVARVTQHPAMVFVSGFLGAHLNTYRSLAGSTESPLDEKDRRELFAGLFLFVEFVCRHAGRRAVHHKFDSLPISTPSVPEVNQRWLIGHQLHSALLQGVIVGLNCFLTARAVPDRRQADASLRLATAMARGSEAVMKLAGRSAPPPPLRPGFIGLQTRDHAFLIRRLRQLRSMFGEPGDLTTSLNGLFSALTDAYATHELIQAGPVPGHDAWAREVGGTERESRCIS